MVKADRCGVCEPGRRSLYRAHTPAARGVWEPWVHAPCPCNELSALRKRVLCPAIDALPSGQLSLRKVVNSFVSVLLSGGKVEPWDTVRVVESYSGRLKRRYTRAAESLSVSPCTGADARLSAFVKAEKFNPKLKVTCPRIIQARDPRYNLELACSLKPLEHRLYSLKGFRWFGVPRSRLIAKGLNLKQRATLVRRKMDAIPECAVIGLDMSAFDAHVASWQLRVEHDAYCSLSASDGLRRLLNMQLRNRGKTFTGIRYSRTGGRASGDFNTGMGNSLLMAGMCVAFLESLDRGLGDKVDCLADGDDALLFVSPSLVSAVTDSLAKFMLEQFGHEAKVETPVYRLEQVTFGQCRPVRTFDGWVMVRNPYKVLSGAFSSHRHWHDIAGGLRVAKVVALCELAISGGVPVLQPFALAAAEALRHVSMATRAEPDDYLLYLVYLTRSLECVKARPITTASRESFEDAWGVSVEDQLSMERGFSRMVFPAPGADWGDRWLFLPGQDEFGEDYIGDWFWDP